LKKLPHKSPSKACSIPNGPRGTTVEASTRSAAAFEGNFERRTRTKKRRKKKRKKRREEEEEEEQPPSSTPLQTEPNLSRHDPLAIR